LLRAYQHIPSHIDVPQSFLSYLNEPPPYNPHRSKDAWDDKSFIDIQLAVLRHYLCWRLEMQTAEVDTLMKTYRRLKNRSFRLIEESLKILEETLGFSKEKVICCCFSSHCYYKCLTYSSPTLEEMLLLLVLMVKTAAAEVTAVVPVLLLGVLLLSYSAIENH
jgi:hypothetical protein